MKIEDIGRQIASVILGQAGLLSLQGVSRAFRKLVGLHLRRLGPEADCADDGKMTKGIFTSGIISMVEWKSMTHRGGI
jgi:hypothetical protein